MVCNISLGVLKYSTSHVTGRVVRHSHELMEGTMNLYYAAGDFGRHNFKKQLYSMYVCSDTSMIFIRYR